MDNTFKLVHFLVDTYKEQSNDRCLELCDERGIYNESSGKCEIIKLTFVIYNNTTKLSEKGYAKINYASNKTSKRRVGL